MPNIVTYPGATHTSASGKALLKGGMNILCSYAYVDNTMYFTGSCNSRTSSTHSLQHNGEHLRIAILLTCFSKVLLQSKSKAYAALLNHHEQAANLRCVKASSSTDMHACACLHTRSDSSELRPALAHISEALLRHCSQHTCTPCGSDRRVNKELSSFKPNGSHPDSCGHSAQGEGLLLLKDPDGARLYLNIEAPVSLPWCNSQA